MMKFATFETLVEYFYKHAVSTPKDQCSNTFQLGVSFACGYVAGIFCAVVSHPADNLVSFLNNAKGATVGDVSRLYPPYSHIYLYASSLCVYLRLHYFDIILMSQAVKKMGLWGLFTRGLPLRIVMIGSLTGAQWGIYDSFKVFVGL